MDVIEQLLRQMLEKNTVVNFRAKWQLELYFAVNVGANWVYQIDKKFVPVNEVYKVGGSYGYDHLNNDMLACLILHGSKVVNLLQAYNGINLDLSKMAVPAGTWTKKFFNTEAEVAAGVIAKSDVQQGDCIAVLVMQ